MFVDFVVEVADLVVGEGGWGGLVRMMWERSGALGEGRDGEWEEGGESER